MFFSRAKDSNNVIDDLCVLQAAAKLEIPFPSPTNRRESLVRVSFVGEMKTGKSTLINGFLKCNVLPTSALPCTVLIHKLQHGPQSLVNIIYKDGNIVRNIGVDELNRHTAKDGLHSDISFISLTSPEVPDGVEVIDTPGFNDPVPDRNALAVQMMTESDAIVFVVDAAQALKGSELPFMEKFLFAGSRKRTILCVNMIDSLSRTELEDVKLRVASEVQNALSPIFGQPVYFVSGKQALKGDNTNSESRLEFESLVSKVRELSKLKPILEQRRRLMYLRDAAVAKRRGLSAILGSARDRAEHAAQICSRIQLVHEGVESVLAGWKQLTQEIEGTIANAFSRLRNDLIASCHGATGGGVLASEFVSQKFFSMQKEMVEKVTGEITTLVADRCAAEITPHIDSITTQHVFVGSEAGHAQGSVMHGVFDEKQAAMGASVLPMVLHMVFGPAGAVVGLIAGYISFSKAVEGQRAAVQESIDTLVSNVENAVNELEHKYRAAIRDALDSASGAVESAFTTKIEALEFEISFLGIDDAQFEGSRAMIQALDAFILDVENLLGEI